MSVGRINLVTLDNEITGKLNNDTLISVKFVW